MSSKIKKPKIICITRSQFTEYINNKTGICYDCKEFVRGIRPDGTGGLCPHCSGLSSVYGIEAARDAGFIVVTKNKKPEKTPEERKVKAQRINSAIDKGKNKPAAKINNIPSEKKKWKREDFAKYYRSSDELSDYSCGKSGVIISKKKR